MRIVTMTRDLRPWRSGEDAFVPDELAEKLIEAGDAKDSRPFPPGSKPEAPASAPAPSHKADRLTPRPRRYMTR